jgi:hypothetical protein
MKPINFVRPLLPNPEIPGTLLVPLTQGLFAIINEADGPEVGKHNWRRSSSGGNSATLYAAGPDDERLHRFLWRQWGLPDTPEIDHENTNGLDCRRDNLRAATHHQNTFNTRMRKGNTSGRKGVSFDRRTKRWVAQIHVASTNTFLGRFDTVEEAAKAYAEAALKMCGEFARVA